MKRWLHPIAAFSVTLLVVACRPSDDQNDTGQPVVEKKQNPEPEHLDPLGPNAACYVCHMTFVGEELTALHVDHQIGCIECHGLSAGHANDENIGATPPDKMFERDQVNPFCRTCHETHDVAPEEVIARWAELTTPQAASQPAGRTAVCTDCHGQHRITND